MYRSGRVVRSMSELAGLVQSGQYVCLRGKPLHPGFIISMTFRTVLRAMEWRQIKRAVRNT